jgi:hypothetical protein
VAVAVELALELMVLQVLQGYLLVAQEPQVHQHRVVLLQHQVHQLVHQVQAPLVELLAFQVQMV